MRMTNIRFDLMMVTKAFPSYPESCLLPLDKSKLVYQLTCGQKRDKIEQWAVLKTKTISLKMLKCPISRGWTPQSGDNSLLFILRSVVLFLRYLSIYPLFQSCSHSQALKLCREGSLCADRCAEEHDSKQIATLKVLEQQLRHISLKSSFDWWL